MERRNDPERVELNIPVTLTTVLHSRTATIVNLNEQGALIAGITAPEGSRFQIDYEGQTVFGIVAWAEPDRIGARFPFGLTDGPLYDALREGRFGFVPMGHATRLSTSPFGRRRSL